MRSVVHAVGMFVLGASALLIPGLLFDARIQQPVGLHQPPPAGITGTSGGLAHVPRRVAARAAEGMTADLDAAAEALAARRAHAAALLDAAQRVADVLRYAAPSRAMSDTYDSIASARRRLQNGDPDGARRLALRLTSAARFVDEDRTGPSVPDERYAGATVLTASGGYSGTVVSVDGDRLVVNAAPWQNLLGLMDLLPRTERVTARDDALLGEPRTIGYTYVIAASP